MVLQRLDSFFAAWILYLSKYTVNKVNKVDVSASCGSLSSHSASPLELLLWVNLMDFCSDFSVTISFYARGICYEMTCRLFSRESQRRHRAAVKRVWHFSVMQRCSFTANCSRTEKQRKLCKQNQLNSLVKFLIPLYKNVKDVYQKWI